MTTKIIVEVLPSGGIAITSNTLVEVAVFDYREFPGEYVPPMVDLKGLYHNRARTEVITADIKPEIVSAAMDFAFKVRDARSNKTSSVGRWPLLKRWLASKIGFVPKRKS